MKNSKDGRTLIGWVNIILVILLLFVLVVGLNFSAKNKRNEITHESTSTVSDIENPRIYSHGYTIQTIRLDGHKFIQCREHLTHHPSCDNIDCK